MVSVSSSGAVSSTQAVSISRTSTELGPLWPGLLRQDRLDRLGLAFHDRDHHAVGVGLVTLVAVHADGLVDGRHEFRDGHRPFRYADAIGIGLADQLPAL